jgi:hypothetical protein
VPHEVVTFDRSKLYAEVWAEAVTKVAKRYAVADVGLRKICKKLSIPLPPFGYLARIQAGQRPRQTPLGATDGPTECKPSKRGNPVS